MQILVIDNNIDVDGWGANELCALARVSQGATIHVRRAPHDDLPAFPDRYDRIVISGSKTDATDQAPWVTRLDEFIRRAVDRGKPIFGICYGHQSLARALGGIQSVRKAPKGEHGWGEIRLNESAKASPLFRGLPSRFHSYQSHNDEVFLLPSGMRALASSETCPLQAIELEGRPVHGVQFHPERNAELGAMTIARKMKKDPSLNFINPKRGQELYDPRIGEMLFRNFLALERT
jgi:GMP synthase (glutamine-hydrolysing)